MQIYWLGKSFIKIVANNATIAIAPYDDKVNIPNFEADLALSAIGLVPSIKGDPFLVEGPGEYETKDIFVYGLHQKCEGKKNHLVFRIEVDNISIGHLSDISCDLSKENIEKLEEVDILIVPVGGGDVLGAKKAASIVKSLEPRMVIPVDHSSSSTDSIESFKKEMGLANIREEEKLKIKHRELPQEETVMVVLKNMA